MSDQIDRFSVLPWETISDCARQKLIDNGEKRVRLLELSAGFREQDWCMRGHTGYIINGTLEVEFKDSDVAYNSGEPLMISSGQPHMARVTSGKTTLFLIDDV